MLTIETTFDHAVWLVLWIVVPTFKHPALLFHEKEKKKNRNLANVAVANISLAGVDKHQIPRLQEGGATIRTLNSHIVQSWLSAMLKRYESVNPQKYVYFVIFCRYALLLIL